MDLIFYRLHTPRGTLTIRQTEPGQELAEVMINSPEGLIEAYINSENPLGKVEWARQGGEWTEMLPSKLIANYLAWQIKTKGIEHVLFGIISS